MTVNNSARKTSDVVIDMGNSRMKVALFVDGRLDGVLNFSNEANKKVMSLIEEADAKRAILSNVGKVKEPLLRSLRENLVFLHLNSRTPIPVSLDYQTPQTLGTDRVANAVSAAKFYPNTNVLIIDFGTCIKYDLVREDQTFLGGAISPGLDMRFHGMHKMTGRLPRIKEWKEKEMIWPGKNTRGSMVSGVLQGIEAEIVHYMAQANERFDDLKVIATGGDFGFFEKAFKNIIFAHPYLTLTGLHEILRFNMD